MAAILVAYLSSRRSSPDEGAAAKQELTPALAFGKRNQAKTKAKETTTSPESVVGDKPWRAAAVGSGSWGNTVAMLVAQNTLILKDWHSEVLMQIFDEAVLTEQDMYGIRELTTGNKSGPVTIPQGGFGTKLSTIINRDNENVKYLPGVKLPDNLKAEPDMETAIAGADLVVVGVPDQYIVPTCQKMKPFLKRSARLILLAKGVEFADGRLLPVTEVVAHELGLPSSQVCCLMGANIAKEVAFGQFSESTLGCKNRDDLIWLQPVVSRPFFPVATVRNVEGPQMCGALKNIVAIGKGILDGMGMSSNTVAALMRIGMKEMKGFILEFFDVPDLVFWESCCFADLITTCMSGRNQMVAAEFARRQGAVTFETLEREMLDGQHLQGTITAVPVHMILKKNSWTKRYPLMEGVYQVVSGNAAPNSILKVLEGVPQTTEL
eukprot:CAMPEP_0171174050 /NCGR_PEP_ID=MMETSP0790-20130122/10531_1 /TAXON_ID=2925 /ORGANISM="Alexandrium catenella, Strain OF101" /LENGTH=435 /DNA_ID=CAMNT_0011638919 /DNA_START=116 /DNA_END=1423 /DNA_ORIENTATION=-